MSYSSQAVNYQTLKLTNPTYVAIMALNKLLVSSTVSGQRLGENTHGAIDFNKIKISGSILLRVLNNTIKQKL